MGINVRFEQKDNGSVSNRYQNTGANYYPDVRHTGNFGKQHPGHDIPQIPRRFLLGPPPKNVALNTIRNTDDQNIYQEEAMNIERNEAFYDKKPSFSDKNSPFDSKNFTSKDHGNEAKSCQSYNNESFSENQLKNYPDYYRNITKESEYFEKYPSITKLDHHSGQIRNMNKKQMNHPARGGVNNAHKLNEVQQKAVSLRKSKGQVFDIEAHSHDFDQIKKSIVDIQMLNHPVYEID